MTGLNVQKARDLLQKFDFKNLFIEELGWSHPTVRQPVAWDHNGARLERRQIAGLSGVVVFEVTSSKGNIPDSKTRSALHKEVSRLHHENLLIFLDQNRTQSLWYWVRREQGKGHPREHLYARGQPGDLFLSKLSAMVVDISEFDETGNLPVVEVAARLRSALDVERVTKKFYRDYQEQHVAFLELIEGIDNERDRSWYASVILNRLMFIYFLQRKHFIDNGDTRYLQNKLDESRQRGRDLYYSQFLYALFFEGFAKPPENRSPEAKAMLGNIRYLNGGLFLEHHIEIKYPKIRILDIAFQNLYDLFARYSWNLNDTPGGEDDEINPDVLGYIFEKYINQKAFGAYYTRPEITEYLCERTIHKLILDRVNKPEVPGVLPERRFDSMADMLMSLNAPLCRELLFVLPELTLLDPACGSGAFLVAAMKTLINVYSAIVGKIKFLSDRNLTNHLKQIEREHTSVAYYIKKRIITDNLFGVDVMEEATEIARLRLFLALVASAQSVDQLEPLPNIDFNILTGNSLIGLMHVEDGDFDRRHAQGNLFVKSYRQVLEEKNRLIKNYRSTSSYAEDLRKLRENIEEKRAEATETLDDILLQDFVKLGIKFEEATWDEAKNKEGKPRKRALKIEDIRKLSPFHWGYEFDEIINNRGGFDAIITNPPWEVFQTDEKEFFQEYEPTIQKNKLRIEDWKRQRAKLMKVPELRRAWLEYASKFPYVSKYFKTAPQYKNQISIINGRNAGSKINLFSYFVEQCFNLLREGGECGIVIPSSIYTDLSTKQLRQMLFEQTGITGLFCFENRKEIFEGVHRSYKFVVLTFRKGGKTKSFPSAFMRHDVEELERFPKEGALQLSVDLIRHLSPDSLSLMEFKNETDVHIAEKMARFPLLGETMNERWNVSLMQEFNMTSDSHLFKTSSGKGRLPLVQGGMFHQFEYNFAPPKYWIDAKKGRASILGRIKDEGQVLSYQVYRFAHRRIARNTDTRTLIACVLPPNYFCADTAQTVRNLLPPQISILAMAILNSLTADYAIRQRVTTHVDMHFMYALRIPRLTEGDPEFAPIVERAARLICTTPEFDDLAREVGLGSHKKGVSDSTERAQIRAEIDGLVAHLYGLTEEEFAYILTTFPLVPEPVKVAARNAYRDVERGLIK